MDMIQQQMGLISLYVITIVKYVKFKSRISFHLSFIFFVVLSRIYADVYVISNGEINQDYLCRLKNIMYMK